MSPATQDPLVTGWTQPVSTCAWGPAGSTWELTFYECEGLTSSLPFLTLSTTATSRYSIAKIFLNGQIKYSSVVRFVSILSRLIINNPVIRVLLVKSFSVLGIVSWAEGTNISVCVPKVLLSRAECLTWPQHSRTSTENQLFFLRLAFIEVTLVYIIV